MSEQLTPKQLHHIINVNGLKTPRARMAKLMDQYRYEAGYKQKGNLQKSIYEITIKTI